MHLEVEQKFVVDSFSAIEAKLAEMDTQIGRPIEQRDLYFAHPVRDFAETDEALRIRRCGRQTFITYKGPRLDATTKTRGELELPLAIEGAAPEKVAEQFAELFTALGFTSVAEVRKHRRQATIEWRDRPVQVVLDSVDGLGVNGVGTFVELELVVAETEQRSANSSIESLAEHLGLARVERRSYLEMLLEKQGC